EIVKVHEHVVPRLVGEREVVAETETRHAGFVFRHGPEATRKTRDRNLVGRTIVESQSPAAGHKAPKGSTVELRLVRWVPDEVGEAPGVAGTGTAGTRRAARRQLRMSAPASNFRPVEHAEVARVALLADLPAGDGLLDGAAVLMGVRAVGVGAQVDVGPELD